MDDEQLEEKKKILTLGDQAAFEQQAAVTQQKNSELIEHLKKQNGDLRTRIIQLQRENQSVHSNDSLGKKTDLQNTLMELKKQLDKQQTEKRDKEKQKKKLSEQLREMEGMAPLGGDSAPKKRIRGLENQLDKIIIKYNEAQSIKKTYEQIMKRLNEEQSNFNSQLEMMEESMRQRNEDHEELLLMQKAARAARDMAHEEVKQLREEMDRDRTEFDRVLEEKRLILQRKLEARERRENEERERQKSLMAESGQGEEGDEGDDELGEGGTRTKRYAVGSSTSSDNQIAQLQTRLAQDEESFRKIKEATGDEDINKVIQKFLVQAEYYKECDERRRATEARLQRAKDGRREAQKQLEEAQAAGVERISAKMQNDESQMSLYHLKTEEDEAKKRYIEAKQLQIEVKEGIKLLCQKMEIATIDPAAYGLREDEDIPHLSPEDAPRAELLDSDPDAVFDKLIVCMEFLLDEAKAKEERDAAERAEKERQREQALEEGRDLDEEMEDDKLSKEEEETDLQVVPEWNTRIHFDDQTDEEDEEEEDPLDIYGTSTGHALDERVMDRESLKRAALDAVELAAQRAKKAKKDEEF
ncbi:putative axonemal dynein intermediate chain protein [Monocercomonoides exilis]|uniref:putative axonemal dynein intermediate chain protein n=1 Tax=Monocercomonoides exilis TaxID=2049356 RepID=UPI00355A2FDA|nr:putative axonemal dynein intermediate chain protein [Monocercomonoides exilis]|eukprot:MONOS_3586.1-p1 / transcript=MONOS_3586.1 / gene=MONOS_3586 / organism=Monocercomonoides_exilis_PA203 / gene_product=axonemal dynein intermediate chain protein / transcript_product=axonemal dynein intermediate chain protein / location=Mono_scaffold00085:117618-119956(+) / protein_length=584 / sequence_SO=supercontig / SO=protein_coding / is_pseudo=false